MTSYSIKLMEDFDHTARLRRHAAAITSRFDQQRANPVRTRSKSIFNKSIFNKSILPTHAPPETDYPR